MKLAPIILFVYNRPWHTRQTIEALQKNELAKESELFIYSDSAKDDTAEPKVRQVRDYIKTIEGFQKVTIVEREKNFGLAANITDGVTRIVNEYEEIIVLEDDLITNPYFLKYMNDGLEFYKDEEQVISIHGYVYPIEKKLPETFFLRGADCWGWGTWKRGWDLFEPDGTYLLSQLKKWKLLKRFDFDGALSYSRMLKNQIANRNDSWAVRWYASALLNNKLTLYPCKSLVSNIGLDSSGTHCSMTKVYDNVLANEPIQAGNVLLQEDEQAYQAFRHFLLAAKGGFWNRVVRFTKGLIT